MKKLMIALALIAVSATGMAVTTEIFRLNSLDAFLRGKSDHVEISVTGEMKPGPALEEMDMNVEAVWSLLEHTNGRIFVGTGFSGKVFLQSGKSLKEILDTDALAVTSLVEGMDGKVYAATLPGGRIFRINADGGGAAPWVKLPDEYVWSMAVGNDGAIYAGTGPKGGIWAIDRKGKQSRVLKLEEDQVVRMAPDGKGNILAGTANGSLYMVEGKTARLLTSFSKMEVSAIAVDNSGEIIVGVNSAAVRAQPPKALKQEGKKNDSADGQKGHARPPSGSASGNREQRGKMQVYRYRPDGLLRPIFAANGMFVNDIEVLEDGAILLATGPRGRIIRLDDQNIPSLWSDLRQGIASDIFVRNGKPVIIGTANPGALMKYTGRTAADATFTGKPLDAGFTSKWGAMTWRADGRVKVETRSGNDETPSENSWSSWRAVASSGSQISSPPGRFIQFRVKWSGGDAQVSDIKIAYRPVNQPPLLLGLRVSAPGMGKRTGGQNNSEGQQNRPSHNRAEASGMVMVEWKAKSPDGDKLAYRLHYRREGNSLWVPLTEKPIEPSRYQWDTSGTPDGWYRLRVTASDDMANPPGMALTDFLISNPFLVDNRRPQTQGLKVDRNNVATGVAVDSFSRITEIAYSVDGGQWRQVWPDDGLLDEKKESFSIKLGKLKKGEHNLAVSVIDEGGNAGAAGVAFTVR